MSWLKKIFSGSGKKEMKTVAQEQPTQPEPEVITSEVPAMGSAVAKAPETEPYTYRVDRVSEKDRWVFIDCNEEDATWEPETFTVLVQKAAKIMNDGVWEGNIIPAGMFVGDTRYRIRNDVTNMVFQYDGLFGIVLEYTPGLGLEVALNYLENILDVEVDEKFRKTGING